MELEKARVARRKRMRRKKTIRLFFSLTLILIFASVGGIFGIYFGVIRNTQQLQNIKIMPNSYTSIIYESNGNEIERLTGGENREYVTLNQIPKYLQNAFIAIEDERFYQHNGIDAKGLFRSAYAIVMRNKVQGASTITQQLIKNVITKVSKNNLKTKLQEQYLAVKFEKELVDKFGSKKSAKDHIIEVYLNTIYLCHGLNGVKTAADYYFGKDVSELTLAECAVIASITKSPTYYAPDINPDNNKTRQHLVLNKMLELNFITQDEYDSALNENVYEKISHEKKSKSEQKSYHTYFVDALIQEISRDLQEQHSMSKTEANNWIYNGGLKIYATVDTKMQGIMDKAFLNDNFFPKRDFEIVVDYYLTVEDTTTHEQKNYKRSQIVKTEDKINVFVDSVKKELINANNKVISERVIPIPQPQAAMVIIDYHNGEVKAISGGRGKKLTDLALNRAIDSKRQPGSVFKVLASFAPAIDSKKATAATIIDDAPYTTGGYTPKNWYKGYRGPSTIRDGIRDSMNIVAVKNMINTGINNCFDYLLKFGFTTLVEKREIDGEIYSDKVASTALGGITDGVNPLEVTAAYGTIANGGEYNKPVFYSKVLDHDGNVLLEHKISSKKVLSPQSSFIITDMMRDVITKGTGTKARFKKLSMPIAGKTGTTTDTKDLTFVGYTPYYVSGIWLGFDQPKRMKEDRGYHLALWSNVMEQVHANLSIKNFNKPNGLTEATICKETGKLASQGCSKVAKEYFISGTEPKAVCDMHAKKQEPQPTSAQATDDLEPVMPEE